MTDPRHRAWNDIHDLLPAGWHVGPTTHEPGLHRWTVVARSPNTGNRLRPPTFISGEGEDELAAVTEPVLEVRELKLPGQMAALGKRMRAVYLAGAEGHSRQEVGRGLSADELDAVIGRFPAARGQRMSNSATGQLSHEHPLYATPCLETLTPTMTPAAVQRRARADDMERRVHEFHRGRT